MTRPARKIDPPGNQSKREASGARQCNDPVTIILSHHRFEEREFFPLLRARGGPGADLCNSLDRLEAEHQADEGYAAEILDLLSDITRGNYYGSPDTAGYMLRGLFESMRRHIAFENEHVLPRARKLLTDADRGHLLAVLKAF